MPTLRNGFFSFAQGKEDISTPIIDDAGFEQLEYAAKSSRFSLSLSPADRGRIEWELFFTARNLLSDELGIDKQEVNKKLKEIENACARLESYLKNASKMKTRSDTPAGWVHVMLTAKAKDVRISEFLITLHKLRSAATESRSLVDPKRPLGRPPSNPLIEHLLTKLIDVFERSSGKQFPKVGISRDHHGQPAGPFFRFAQKAIEFIPNAPKLTPDALGELIRRVTEKRRVDSSKVA